MKDIKYVQCKNCSTVHYVIDKDDVLELKKEEGNTFSKRNLKYCFNCGKKDKFIEILKEDIGSYLSGSEIPTICLEKK